MTRFYVVRYFAINVALLNYDLLVLTSLRNDPEAVDKTNLKMMASFWKFHLYYNDSFAKEFLPHRPRAESSKILHNSNSSLQFS